MHSLKVFLSICGINIKKLLIYRASFFISLILMFVWVFAYLILIEVIFLHTDTLAGWNKGQVILMMSFYYFIQNFSDIFFKDNFENFGTMMRRGELDFRLLKPAPERMLCFFWDMRFDHIAGLFISTGMLTYALKTMETSLSLGHFIAGFGLISISLILYYSILSMIASLTFWVDKNETFNVLIFNVTQLSRYPRQIYKNTIGAILTFGVPLALIAAVPAETALGHPSTPLIIFFVGIAAFFYVLSRIIWHYGVRRYSSAN